MNMKNLDVQTTREELTIQEPEKNTLEVNANPDIRSEGRNKKVGKRTRFRKVRKICRRMWKNAPLLVMISISSLFVMLFWHDLYRSSTVAEIIRSITPLKNGGIEEIEDTVQMENDASTDIQIGNDASTNDEGKTQDTVQVGNENTDDDERTDNENGDKLNEELINGEDSAAKNTDAEGESKEIPTKYKYYAPKKTDSIYYSDPGKVALTTEYPFSTVDESYFRDAAFIGDSRTLGISDYAGFDEADFYCENSMTIFKLMNDEGITYQKTRKKVDLKETLQNKQYGKIYLMVGINELGYGNTQMYYEKYREVVEQIRVWQPDAILYIMANLHVSEEKNNEGTEFNNININDKNAAVAHLANGIDIFYLDENEFFTDDNGYLKGELTFDGVHLRAQYYELWRKFLMEHAVVKK